MNFTPLQAGVFILPIMVAAAIGGPIAGYLSNLFGLRWIATISLLMAAGALIGLGYSSLNAPGLIVPVILALIGLSLNIGLTASSIAIMGSVSAEKGGAAGSLEATGYELGTGLGIKFFGVFKDNLFSRHINVPEAISSRLAEQARLSIGDSYLVAAQLSEAQSQAIILAAKQAFSTIHMTLLNIAGIMMLVLAAVVYVMLKKYCA